MGSDDHKIERIFQLLDDVQAQLLLARQEIEQLTGGYTPTIVADSRAELEETDESNVIEGVFDGQNMVGPDGKIYTVPANYASKSKLLEGDILKLSIQPDGSFVYKQIGPVRRERIVGTLVRDPKTGNYQAVAEDGRGYRLLTASVTYYKGQPNDTVVMLVAEDGQTTWAAVENILPPDAVIDDMEYDNEEFFDDEDVESIDDAFDDDEPLDDPEDELMLDTGDAGTLPGPKITT